MNECINCSSYLQALIIGFGARLHVRDEEARAVLAASAQREAEGRSLGVGSGRRAGEPQPPHAAARQGVSPARHRV